MHRFRALLAASLVFILGSLGCGGAGGKISVNVKIIPDPKVQLEADDTVTIVFLSKEKGKIKPGEGSATQAKGELLDTKAQVEPGKYFISVKVEGYSGKPETEKRKGALAGLSKKYTASAGDGGGRTGKLEVEITSATKNVTIDLKEGKATAD